MNYRLELSKAAEEDLRDAFLWYDKEHLGLGSRFEEEVANAITYIGANPLKLQIRYGETRVCFLRKFPYGIHFTVEGQFVVIVAVFHTSRSPRLWTKR